MHARPDRPDRPDRLDSHTGFLIAKLGGAATARFDLALAPAGLRGRHLRVLEAIHGEALPQRELCERIGMDRTTMVAVVDELEQLGYARRERSVADRRKSLVTLTNQGAVAFHNAAQRLRMAEDELLAPLSAEQRAHLNQLLARLSTPSVLDCTPSALQPSP
jgi:DNA-binding MarR family transcriptional regulator